MIQPNQILVFLQRSYDVWGLLREGLLFFSKKGTILSSPFPHTNIHAELLQPCIADVLTSCFFPLCSLANLKMRWILDPQICNGFANLNCCFQSNSLGRAYNLLNEKMHEIQWNILEGTQSSTWQYAVFTQNFIPSALNCKTFWFF